MHCSRIRTALSARLDGEERPPGLTDRLLDDHLAGCAQCRRWQARAEALTADIGRAAARSDAGPASADALLARLRAASSSAAASD
ncbi:zf-HC2 domain-containing protein [Streptomyces sp. NPDC048650]|uniref:zf-HC2 domain-containing protein n=1 Tax=unclassified Streptomyces TaxID=2593676 RepID=UPI00371401FD